MKMKAKITIVIIQMIKNNKRTNNKLIILG